MCPKRLRQIRNKNGVNSEKPINILSNFLHSLKQMGVMWQEQEEDVPEQVGGDPAFRGFFLSFSLRLLQLGS
jgi:hypothetical protein